MEAGAGVGWVGGWVGRGRSPSPVAGPLAPLGVVHLDIVHQSIIPLISVDGDV